MTNGQIRGPRDSDLILRSASDGDLTGDETLTFEVDPEAYSNPLSVYVRIPATPTGTTPELEVTVKGTDDNAEVETTHTDHITDTVIPGGLSEYPATLVLPVPWTKGDSYSVVLNMVNVADENFGEVEVWVARGAQAVVPNA